MKIKKELTKFKTWAIKNGYDQDSKMVLLWYFNRKGRARRLKNGQYEVMINKKWVTTEEVIKDG